MARHFLAVLFVFRIFKFNLGGFRGMLRVVRGWACFFMSNGGGIMEKFGLEVDLWWFWDFENIFVYN